MFCEHNAKAKKEGLCAKCAELKPYIQFKTCKNQCFACKECGLFYGPGAGEDKAGRPVPERPRSHSVLDEEPPPGWQPSESDLQRMKDEPYLDLDAHLGNADDEKRGLEWLKTQLSRYTRERVRCSLEGKYDEYLLKLTANRPANWKCDQQTKDNFCLSQWLIDELTSLNAEQTDRIDTQGFFNRKARAENDLYEVAALAMNNFLDGKIERYRRIERS
jgi:hypothetical protein